MGNIGEELRCRWMTFQADAGALWIRTGGFVMGVALRTPAYLFLRLRQDLRLSRKAGRTWPQALQAARRVFGYELADAWKGCLNSWRERRDWADFGQNLISEFSPAELREEIQRR